MLLHIAVGHAVRALRVLGRLRHHLFFGVRVDLRAAGFGAVRIERLREDVTHTRDRLLDVIRGRAFSTFDLLDEEEIRRGTEQAERELPDPVEFEVDYLLAFGRR